jgi:hypothetical protein
MLDTSTTVINTTTGIDPPVRGPRTRATDFGYHFFDEFRSCPRKWYFNYILHEPKLDKAALLLGSAWHKGLEQLLLGKSVEEAVSEAQQIFAGPQISARNFEIWLEKIGPFLPAEGNPIAVEKEIVFPLQQLDFSVTARIDGIWGGPELPKIILEHKTTSANVTYTLDNLENSDQLTMYLLGAQKIYGPISYALADVTIFDKNKPEAPVTITVAELTRTAEEIELFEAGLAGTVIEMESRLKSLRGGVPPDVLFPRYPSTCEKFGCPYVDICRNRLRVENVSEGILDAFHLSPEEESQ